MGTRSVIGIRYDNRIGFDLWYNHYDSYPSGLGRKLIEKLKSGNRPKEIIQELDLEPMNKHILKIGEAFPKVRADLEWLYTINYVQKDRGLSTIGIYKTSFPHTEKDFTFRVWGSYLKYVGADIENTLHEVERTAIMVVKALSSFEGVTQS